MHTFSLTSQPHLNALPKHLRLHSPAFLVLLHDLRRGQPIQHSLNGRPGILEPDPLQPAAVHELHPLAELTLLEPILVGNPEVLVQHAEGLNPVSYTHLRCHLPRTNIQTDSYVAVQLLEQDGRLDAETIGNTAARLEGSFSLTILNQFNHLYLVKGNSPLCIYRFENGLICYASTADILKEALARCSFLPVSYTHLDTRSAISCGSDTCPSSSGGRINRSPNKK